MLDSDVKVIKVPSSYSADAQSDTSEKVNLDLELEGGSILSEDEIPSEEPSEVPSEEDDESLAPTTEPSSEESEDEAQSVVPTEVPSEQVGGMDSSLLEELSKDPLYVVLTQFFTHNNKNITQVLDELNATLKKIYLKK